VQRRPDGSVASSSINDIVQRSAGRPQQVVQKLIDAANDAGGKDNVTVVYVEGEQFPPARPAIVEEPPLETEITRRLGTTDAPGTTRQRLVRLGNIVLITIVIVLTSAGSDRIAPQTSPRRSDGCRRCGPDRGARVAVDCTGPAARAAGTTIVVEPGEYRETLMLKSGVRLTSSVPHGAIVRLPVTASERAAAIVARGVTDAALDGFRIVGDAATPLGTGVLATDSMCRSRMSKSPVLPVSLSTSVEDRASASSLPTSGTIRDRPLWFDRVRPPRSPSAFTRNGSAAGAQRTVIVEAQGAVEFHSNVFVSGTMNLFTGPSHARAAFARANWFVEARAPRRDR
jgi:hypothetical protein